MVALSGLVLCTFVGTVHAQIHPTRVQGELKLEDGTPLGRQVLVFEPADAGTTELRREMKVGKSGKFRHSFFPAGTYRISLLGDEYFLRSIHVIIRDKSGAMLLEQQSDADPDEGLPPVRLIAGGNARIELTAADPSVRRKLKQAMIFREMKGPLAELREAFSAGEMQKVVDLSDTVLEKDPDIGPVLYVRGVALTDLGRPREASEVLRRAAELTPDQPGVFGALGLALLRQAQAARKEGTEDSETIRAMFAEAAEAFGRELETASDDLPLLINRGVALRDAGRREDAIKAFEKVIEQDPSYLNAYFQIYALLDEMGQREQALAVLSRAPGADEEVAKALYNEAVALYNRDEYEAAKDMLARAEAKDPSLTLVYRLRGYLLLKEGKVDEAVALLERFVEAQPDHPDAEADRALIAALKESASGSAR